MLDALIGGLITGNAYALVAVGISLIFGVARLINFAHGSVFGIGAMVGWWLIAILGWPFWAALAGVVVSTAALGWGIERLALRGLASAPPIAALLATVAVGLILDYGSQLLFTPETRRLPTQLETANFRIGGVPFGTLDIAILLVTIFSVVGLWAFLRFFRWGLAIRATAQDPEAARQMGIEVDRVRGLSFALASGLAGIAGLLVGMYYGSVDPTVGFSAGLTGFVAATLGGLGSLSGAVIGGLLLGVAESFGVTWFGGSARPLITFALLVAVLAIRPSGLFSGAHAPFGEPLTGTFFGGRRPLAIRRWHGALLLVVLCLVLPLVGDDYLLRVGALVAMFAVIALSLTLVAGLAGQISLGQAGLVGVGAYTSALLVKDHGWSFWLALPAAGCVAAVIGAVLIGPTLRLSGHYVSIATLAIGGGVSAALLNLEPITRGPLGISAIPPPNAFGHEIVSPRDYYLLTLGAFLVCGGVITLLRRSHLGRAWRAIREDEVAAASFGVPVKRYKALAFALSSLVAGIGGSLLAHQYSFINPSIFSIVVSVQALTIVVLGGLSNVAGAAVGAVILVGLPELFRPLADARTLLFGVLLILLVHFRPQGLFGSD